MGEPPKNLSELGPIFGNLVGALLGFVAIVLFLMLLLGGFKYLTSGGDPKAAESARNTLTYAIFGLVAIVLSYLVLVFIQEITGANILNFEITL